MPRVAKLILVNKDNEYLLLYRSGHPTFPNDPDLPGGRVEDDEQPAQALIRELAEETGIALKVQTLEKLCQSDAYHQGFTYYLYTARVSGRPDVTISWEHDRYEWLPLKDFTAKTRPAIDTYMHMVHDYLVQHPGPEAGPKPTKQHV